MAEVPLAPYLPTPDPDIFESTPLAASGWYDDGQHGGVVSALLTRAIELVPVLTPMALARVTVELFRVGPVALLKVSSEVIRQGKKDPGGEGLSISRRSGACDRNGTEASPG